MRVKKRQSLDLEAFYLKGRGTRLDGRDKPGPDEARGVWRQLSSSSRKISS
jgi:hypothetical protein